MEEPDHPCQFCDKSFKKYYRLSKHLYNEHIKPTCTVCNASFRRMKELKDHAINEHDLKMNKLCSICKKAFTNRTDLENHLHEEHSKERPYHCTKCPKLFSTEERLELHMTTHSRMKPSALQDPSPITKTRRSAPKSMKALTCPDCGLEFQIDAKLRKRICELHSESVRQKSSEDIACKYCEMPFYRRGFMLKHVRLNHPEECAFKCETCGFVFETSEEFDKHVQRHTDEKPFICDVCGRYFWKAESLKKHAMRFHSKENDKNTDDRGKPEGIILEQMSELKLQKITEIPDAQE